jgi:4'-phosphopantetheinyl transferase
MSNEQSTASLLPDEVHLWTVELSSNRNESLRFVVTPDEHERAGRFRNPVDGERYLTAHGALRVALASYLNCQPRDIPIRKRELGKPFVDGTDLEFNLSHSGSKALIAVARGRPVGVDIERIRTVPDQDGILARIATAEECEAFAALAPAEREMEFFLIWTRTEALCKATGVGIGALAPPCRESIDRCRLVHVRDLDGYAACVAAERFDWRLVRMTRHPDSP